MLQNVSGLILPDLNSSLAAANGVNGPYHDFGIGLVPRRRSSVNFMFGHESAELLRQLYFLEQLNNHPGSYHENKFVPVSNLYTVFVRHVGHLLFLTLSIHAV